MNIELDKNSLIQAYGNLVLPLVPTSNVIKTLKADYQISQIDYIDMDPISRSIHSIFNDGQIFRLDKTADTISYFLEVEDLFGEGTGVYIFQKENQLYSNSRALELELLVLKGISQEDILWKTPAYFHYLIQVQLLEQLSHNKLRKHLRPT